MITNFIKNGKSLFMFSETDNDKDIAKKIEEINEKETVNTVEFVFNKKTKLSDVEEMLLNQDIGNVLAQNVYLND
jgi:hypothetical protein